MRLRVSGVAPVLIAPLCLAALATLAAVACSSFGSSPSPRVEDAAAADATSGDGAPTGCTLPLATDDSIACAADCSPTELFPQGVALAVVRARTAFVVLAGSNEVRKASPVATGSLEPLGGAGASVVDGTPTYIEVDSQHVYVSTSAEEVRFPIGGGAKEPLLRDTSAGAGPLRIGGSVIYQLQPGRLVRLGKDLLDSSLATVLVVVDPTFALDVDGDRAFWIGTSSVGDRGLLGPFPEVDNPFPVDPTVRSFVVRGGFAYVAETSGKSGIVARLRLGTREREVVAHEPSLIEALYIDGDKLYWTANRFGAGDRVLVRADVCGGPTTVLATELPPLGPLSFDDTYVYASAAPTAGLLRMRK